jgi:predicted transcriptional regulator
MTNEQQTLGVEVEEWRPCYRYPKYEVSSLGRMRNATSQHQKSIWVNKRTGRRITRLDMGKCPLGARRPSGRFRRIYRTIAIGPVVAEAFLGLRPEGMQVDHIDGNKVNDAASNLQWVTQSVNIYRAYHVQNLRTKESQRAMSNMTQADYDEVFRLSKLGISQVQIGKRLGRNNSTISKILSGKITGKIKARVVRVRRPRIQDVYREVRLARIEVVRKLRAESPGMSVREIASVLGVSQNAVFSYLRTLRGR